MDSLRSWVADPAFARSVWLGLSLWVGLLAKLTLALSVSWLLHASLWQANPRWRRLLWRTTAVGCAMIALSLIFPPLLSWGILPGEAPPEVSQVADAPPAPREEPASSARNVPRPQQQRGFDFSPQSPFAHRIHRDSAPNRIETQDAEPRDIRRAVSPATVPSALPLANPQSTAPNRTVSLSMMLAGTWMAGVVPLTLYTCFGIYRLSGIRRRATPAPVAVLERAQQIGIQLGCRRVPSILVSDEAASPCILGVLRPVILLPTVQSTPALAHELPAILAHELAHLRGHDVAWQLVIHAIAILGWFHPLLWRTRAAHALACDAVSDCVAADYVGDAAGYGRTLARLALRMVPTAATGMAMAQGSTVRRRIEMLRRRLFPASLRRGHALCAVLASLAMFLLIGGLALAQAEPSAKKPPAAEQAKPIADAAKRPDAPQAKSQPTSEPSTEPSPTPAAEPTVVPAETQPKSIKIDVTDATGSPVGKARIRFVGRVNGKRFDRFVRTDADGHATFDVPMAGEFTNFWMQCEKPGLVAIHYTWTFDNQEIKLPAKLDLRMESGVKGGGVVNDEAGRPINNAKIEVMMPITWPRRANHVYTVVEAKTDEQGRWDSPNLPANLTDVSVNVSHPDYIQGHGKFSGRENLAVLTQGLTVAGRVTDADGKPIAKAKARAGFSRFGTTEPETTTDADGRFVLKNCKEGRSVVTVQADGFAPQFQEILIGPKNDDVNFQLTPGHTVRVRLVDPRGNPVQGVYFCTDTWRGYRTLDLRIQTDGEGRAEWRGAPDDTVLCDFFKSGHMSTRQVPIKAGADEIIVKIPDELVISGTVTDAETGKPIPEFGVRSGLVFENSDRVYLSQDDPTKFQNGAYTFKFSEAQRELLLEFSAEGYTPLESKHFVATDGKQTFDAKLTRTQGSSGTVLRPDGQPAAGAEVALATAEIKAQVYEGRFRRGATNTPIVKTDSQGKFTLTPRDDRAFLLVVVHDAGFAEVTEDELASGKEIRLTPWGRIEGRVMRGDKPDANREVSFSPKSDNGTRSFIFSYSYTTETDKDGRFEFDRVIPGPGWVSRVVVTKFIDSTSHAPCWQVPVDVPPSGSVTATIGGVGRPVVGKVKLDRQPDVAIDWTTNEPATINLQESGVKNPTYFRCGSNIDRDGKFTIPDVPAGKYKLSFNINNPPTPNACGAGEAIGRATLDFEVPPLTGERSDEPLDLGTITATLFDTLEPGEVAPDFVLAGLNGDSVRLSNFHGKLVLLDFWATWCQPCLAEMPGLAEVQKEFGDNPRFALVGLSCDQQIEPAREYVQKNGYGWTQAHAGAAGAGIGSIAGKYAVRAIPATYLIGPDGKVLAKNLRGKELKQAVAAALADDALFKGAESMAPAARFPVVRFQPDPTPVAVGETPAVVLMLDSDSSFEKDHHDDRLVAYSANGTELWTVNGLSGCVSVGGGESVVADPARGRLYVKEDLAQRLAAFNLSGQKLWQLENLSAHAMVVDSKTGNLWVTGGPSLNQGETIVIDPQGNEVSAYPFVGIDIVADQQRDVFWLAGYKILQCDRSGEVRVRVPVNKSGGWCCATVALDPSDGSAWFGEREHPDVPDSRNRLWHVDSSGQVLQKIELDKSYPLRLARDPASGDLWIVSYPREIRRLGADGKFKDSLAIEANNIAFGSANGTAWATTEKELLKLDTSGKVILRKPLEKPSVHVWATAF